MYVPLMNDSVTECDTCGTSYHELTVEFDAEEPARPWHGSLTYGCYGGSTCTGTREEVIAWLLREGEHLVAPTDLAHAVSVLRNA